MSIFVTGGCGFVGTHVCEYYARSGMGVVAYDNMTKYELARTHYDVERARDHNANLLSDLGVKLVANDIRDLDAVLESARGCSAIVHTAAQPAMTISLEEPTLDFTTNVVGTYNVLMAARELQIPVVVFSTIHVYGNELNNALSTTEKRYQHANAPFDETLPVLQGNLTPLHASKRSAEIYAEMFMQAYGVRVGIFRLTGIYGPYQFGGEDHGWVANFCIRASHGEPINIFGTGKQVRDIVYATDVVGAVDAFIQSNASGIFNIGGGTKTATSLLECIDLIAQITGKQPDIHFHPERQGDLSLFVCDTAKALREFGWQAEVQPTQGLEEMLGWIDNCASIFRTISHSGE